jgi:hypothetical protein
VGDFSDLFSRLKLYQELAESAGRDDIAQSEVTQLQGLVVTVARESNDPAESQKAVSNLASEALFGGAPVNLQCLACCLRLADTMDFDRSCTPPTVFQHLSFTEERSWDE